ncbi:MAG: hypothetical protein Kow00121_32630 [Elainellaceae cyanobacterium]
MSQIILSDFIRFMDVDLNEFQTLQKQTLEHLYSQSKQLQQSEHDSKFLLPQVGVDEIQVSLPAYFSVAKQSPQAKAKLAIALPSPLLRNAANGVSRLTITFATQDDV